MAVSVAGALRADKLLFLTDVDGVRGENNVVYSTLNADQCRQLIAAGIATGGMRAKLESAMEALQTGTAEVVIAPGATVRHRRKAARRRCHRHSTGSAAEVSAACLVSMPVLAVPYQRSGTPHHPQGDHARYSRATRLDQFVRRRRHHAARTEFEISENIRDFTVVYDGSQLLGCGALHFYTPTSGEIRSLAVAPEARKQGIGVLLIEALENEAINNDLHSIFAFTYVADFFRKVGFPRSGPRPAPPESLEGLLVVFQVPVLR